MNRIIRTFAALACALIVSSCASSLVYDPSLHLPARPMRTGDGQVSAGAAYLLETRPDAADRMGVIGPTIQVRGRFGPSITVGAKHWFTYSDIGDDEDEYRGGVAVDVAWRSGDTSDAAAFSVIGRAASLFGEHGYGGIGIDGGGVSVQGLLATPLGGSATLSSALGPVFGFSELDGADDPEWGLGVIANVGLGIEIVESVDAIVELSGLVYHDANVGEVKAAASPSLALSIRF